MELVPRQAQTNVGPLEKTLHSALVWPPSKLDNGISLVPEQPQILGWYNTGGLKPLILPSIRQMQLMTKPGVWCSKFSLI